MIGALTRRASIREARADAAGVIALCGLGPHATARARRCRWPCASGWRSPRALATLPRLLLLDEVMAGLNPTELAGMVDLVRRLHAEG
jgi:ABC-type branched-subunit amino acid transport system ATPase component